MQDLRILKNGDRINLPEAAIVEFCRRNHIRRMALFGSVLRDDFQLNSDVNILVEFDSGWTPGLSFFTLQDELSTLIGRRVDLNTPGSLSKYFRDEVIKEAEDVYVSS